MSSSISFDLDSDSYNDFELEQMLNLKNTYSDTDVQLAKQKLSQQLFMNFTDLGVEKQRQIMFFLDTICQRLLNKVSQRSSGGYETNVLQQGNSFIIENVDRRIGLNSKVADGRITTGGSVDLPPGHLNPINVRTIMQAISIDSRFRPNYYATKSTNFDVTLPSIQKNVVSMRVASIELPITYYAVSRSMGNSTCLILDTMNVGEAWLLTLPDGNYEQSWASNSNAAPLEPAMQDAIANALPCTVNAEGKIVSTNPSGTHLDPLVDLGFTIDRISGRAIFGIPPGSVGSIFATDGFSIRFNVDVDGNLNVGTTIQLRLGWQLGFRSAEYTTLTRIVSEGICLVSGPRYGFISIDDYQKNTGPTYVVAYANSILQDNIITRINLAELQADVGVYQSSSDPGLSNQLNRTREYFGAVDIQRLHIALYDEFGRVIDLNNMDWSITLAFEILYN